MPEVIACHLVSGDHDFLLEVVISDMATYEATVLRVTRSSRNWRHPDIFRDAPHKSNGPLPLDSAGIP
nr:Lrp/AsnC ligand binding domain-containing protein [Rhizobium leguminosarum]